MTKRPTPLAIHLELATHRANPEIDWRHPRRAWRRTTWIFIGDLIAIAFILSIIPLGTVLLMKLFLRWGL